jgi:hypothetical protein
VQARAVPLAECLPAALEFRNANRPAARDDSYISWRYLQRPSQQATFVVWLEESGARVAAATVAPHDFVVGGEARRIGIVGDISVAAAARGRGLARPLLESVVSESAGKLDGLMVMPNPPVFSALRSAGWREVAGLPRYVRFVGAGPAGAGGVKGIARRLARAAFAGAVSLLDRNVSIPSGFRLDVQTTLPRDYAAFWEETSRSHALIGSRAPEYLEWRYLRHPIYRYTFLVLTGPGGTQGYAMTRQDGADIWVDDWLVKDEHAGAALGAALLAWVRRGSSAATLQTRTADTTAATIPWKRLGFLRRSDTQAVFVAGAWRDQAAERAPAWLLTPGDKDV